MKYLNRKIYGTDSNSQLCSNPDSVSNKFLLLYSTVVMDVEMYELPAFSIPHLFGEVHRLQWTICFLLFDVFEQSTDKYF